MDKQNYTLSGKEAQEIKGYYSHLEEELIRKAGAKILKRKRVLKHLKDLISAIYLYFVKELSFQRLSDVMSCKYGIVMSDTAWRKQILKAAPILWEEMKAIQEKTAVPRDKDRKVLKCSSVYAIDATDIPAQGGTTTARRIHTQFSLTEHRCTFAEVTDCHGGENLKRFSLKKGALYFADRAYGRTPQLAYALDQGAHFLIRIAPHQVKFFRDPECQDPFSFPDIFLEKTVFSTIVYFKRNKKVYHVRILGRKLPEEKQAQAEKRVRRKANRNHRKASAQAIEASKWLILATSFPETKTFSTEALCEQYRLRWQIELHFKKLKTLLRLRKFRRSSDRYQDAMSFLWLTLASWIALLQLRIFSLIHFFISDFYAFSLALHCFP